MDRTAGKLGATRRWSSETKGEPMAGEAINVLALVKGEERYIFLFGDHQRQEMLTTLGRFATNPELSFSWYDAAILGPKVRKVTTEGSAKS